MSRPTCGECGGAGEVVTPRADGYGRHLDRRACERCRGAARPRVYIAGPISRGDLAGNITQATRAFVQLAAAGFAPWCPHWSAFSGPIQVTSSGSVVAIASAGGCGLDHAGWLAVDLSWVEVADAVVRLPGDSAGADRETAHARAVGVPVFDGVADLLARWGKPHGGDPCPGPALCDACGG